MGRLREIARENSFKTAEKKILIAGGGPAGMQAALGALERGHKVILCEASDSLGKTLSYSDHIEFKQDIRKFRDSLISRIENSQVEVRMNTAVTPELIRNAEPDLVIGAIGGEPFIPPIEGIADNNVLYAASMHQSVAVPGNKTVIIGGGLMGCEEAIALAQEGKNVTVVEMTDSIAGEADSGLKQMIDEKIAYYNIPVLTGCSCMKITEEGAIVKNKDGEERMLAADSVLIAAGVRPKDSETNRLRDTCYDLGIDFIAVGDCKKTGRIREATTGGYFAGRNA
ncbi:NAD(P)/FAD-dependent oxidoreductase [Blautia hominis]